jgi:hypothetical protein
MPDFTGVDPICIVCVPYGVPLQQAIDDHPGPHWLRRRPVHLERAATARAGGGSLNSRRRPHKPQDQRRRIGAPRFTASGFFLSPGLATRRLEPVGPWVDVAGDREPFLSKIGMTSCKMRTGLYRGTPNSVTAHCIKLPLNRCVREGDCK